MVNLNNPGTMQHALMARTLTGKASGVLLRNLGMRKSIENKLCRIAKSATGPLVALGVVGEFLYAVNRHNYSLKMTVSKYDYSMKEQSNYVIEAGDVSISEGGMVALEDSEKKVTLYTLEGEIIQTHRHDGVHFVSSACFSQLNQCWLYITQQDRGQQFFLNQIPISDLSTLKQKAIQIPGKPNSFRTLWGDVNQCSLNKTTLFARGIFARPAVIILPLEFCEQGRCFSLSDFENNQFLNGSDLLVTDDQEWKYHTFSGSVWGGKWPIDCNLGSIMSQAVVKLTTCNWVVAFFERGCSVVSLAEPGSPQFFSQPRIERLAQPWCQPTYVVGSLAALNKSTYVENELWFMPCCSIWDFSPVEKGKPPVEIFRKTFSHLVSFTDSYFALQDSDHPDYTTRIYRWA